MKCQWSWKRLRCLPPLPPPAPPPEYSILFHLALLFIAVALLLVVRNRPPGLFRTLFRLVFCRGQRRAGRITGIKFPIHAGQLTPQILTEMLHRAGHLNAMTTVTTVSDRLAVIRDGVKGDKAIIDVTYSNPTNLPTTFFVWSVVCQPQFMEGLLSANRSFCKVRCLPTIVFVRSAFHQPLFL